MNKKTITIVTVVSIITLIGIFSFVYISRPKEEIDIITNNKSEEKTQVTTENSIIEFLRSVHGLKIDNVELINNPVGIEGVFLAPRESIRNGVDYFLKESNNEKLDKVDIDIGHGYIKARVNYKITNKITTPIEVKVIPSLNKNKDLLLTLNDVKFLDLNIAKWIVDIGVKSFVKDLFSKDSDLIVEFDKGNVIIDKSNFKGVTLKNISIDSKELMLDMSINLEELIK